MREKIQYDVHLDIPPAKLRVQRKNPLYWLARAYMRIQGWEILGDLPKMQKFVYTACPHTSNWDVPVMLCMATLYELPHQWFIKDEWIRRPIIGSLLVWLGAVGIDRSKSNGVVGTMVDLLDRVTDDGDPEKVKLAILVPATGTRKREQYWKSGFLHIAQGAGVPIALGFMDWEKKKAGFAQFVIDPTHDVTEIMRQMRAFYGPVVAKHQKMKSHAQLKEEHMSRGNKAREAYMESGDELDLQAWLMEVVALASIDRLSSELTAWLTDHVAELSQLGHIIRTDAAA